MKKGGDSIMMQGSILAAAGIISRIIGMVYRIPMSNMLGTEGNTLYSIAFSIYNVILTISSYSLPLAVSKLISQYSAKKEYKNTYKIFKTAFFYAAILGGAGSAFLYFGADFLERIFPGSVGLSKPLKILAPAVFVMAVLGALRGLFQGKNTMLPTAISQVLEQIVNAFVSIWAIYVFMNSHRASKLIFAYGAAGGVLGTFMGAVTAFLFLGLIFSIYRPALKNKIMRDRHTLGLSGGIILKMLVFTVLPITLSQTVYQLGYFLDNFIFKNIMHFKGFTTESNSVLGVFNTQYNLLINVPVAVSSAMASSAVPSMVASFAKGSYRELKEKAGSLIKFNMTIAFPAAAGLAVLAKPIVTLLFPGLSSYGDVAAKLLITGSTAVIFYSYSTITGAMLQGINRIRIPVVHSAVSLIIHIILVSFLLFCTNLGIYVLILGNITFPLLVCILNWRAVAKFLQYKQELRKTFLFPLLAAAIMGIIAGGSYRLVYYAAGSNAIGVILSMTIAACTYLILILIFRCFSKEELKDLPMGKKICRLGEKMHLY